MPEDSIRVSPEDLRRLFYYLIDTVLERPAEEPAVVVPLGQLATTENNS